MKIEIGHEEFLEASSFVKAFVISSSMQPSSLAFGESFENPLGFALSTPSSLVIKDFP